MHAPGNAKPTILAAGSSYLTSFYGDGWVAAGDAAASFDPLSSQGLVTAMATGRAAATAILNHEAGDGDAMAWYAAALEGEIRRYMRQRTAYYGMECRWPDAPFWQRRHVHFAPA
ncbi:MAG: Dehydrogenase flavoprotein LodB [Phycisphaerales bacterium]|nr:Dehydrogenase flavoprotein LodB [Phycisphaerales bacterium]